MIKAIDLARNQSKFHLSRFLPKPSLPSLILERGDDDLNVEGHPRRSLSHDNYTKKERKTLVLRSSFFSLWRQNRRLSGWLLGTSRQPGSHSRFLRGSTYLSPSRASQRSPAACLMAPSLGRGIIFSPFCPNQDRTKAL